MSITTRAAVRRVPGRPWEITELELDDPRANEVRVRLFASGLCHFDLHRQPGDAPARLPVAGGHEGAGVVDAVGPGVTRVRIGDHVTVSPIAVCGSCRYCATGRQMLCGPGANATLGTFSQYAVVHEYSVIKIPAGIGFEVAALVACGVPTGWGSAVRAGGVRAGQTVVIYGAGGVGSSAVQGAALAGARNVIVVDPVEFKRKMATTEFGASHAFATAGEAYDFVVAATRGELAEHAIITVGVLDDAVIAHAINVVGKNGQVTITALGNGSVNENPVMLIGYQRRIQGALYGGCSPLADVPLLIGLYQAGRLKLDELITRRYALDEINQGFQDMLDGSNIRGVIVHEH